MKNLKPSKFLLPGIAGITLWPFGIYVKYGYEDNVKLKVHENIHWEQQKELPIIFYILYLLEWIIKIFLFGNPKTSYRNLSAEREANKYENDPSYFFKRKRWHWLKYIFVND
jgi:hypothetical protein